MCSWDMGGESQLHTLLHDSVSLVYLVPWVQSILLTTQQLMEVLGQGLPHL